MFARRTRALAPLAATVLLLAACDGTPPSEPTGGEAAAAQPSAQRYPGVSASVSEQLNRLHKAVDQVGNFAQATSTIYTAQITPCMVMPGAGGMGFHYANPNIIDGVVDPVNPEVLLYEPQGKGGMKLVGVEFIIPYSFVPRDATPPHLLGRDMKQNDTFQVWALHAWVFKHNRKGVFADWNPTVRC